MKQPKKRTSVTHEDPLRAAPPASDRGRLFGLGAVVAITVFVGLLLYVKGRPALDASHAVTQPRLLESSRFNSNAWNLPNDALLGFVAIPAGKFTMGSDPSIDRTAYENERWSQEQRQGSVDLPLFYIGRYEVTIAQLATFVADTHRKVDTQTLRGSGDLPVSNVTWTEALAYAKWLEARLRTSTQTPTELKRLLDSGWHLTLPNEAQWEKAARGTDGRVYPWGHSANDSKANYARSGVAPVGQFACVECAFELADMAGNVWELTRSPLQAYPWSSIDEPRDAQADALFVMRGGAYTDSENNVRAAVRGGIDPGARRPFIGFRLVLEKS